MKILGISGSPARDGITSKLLDSALDGAVSSGASVEKVILNDLEFRPCQQCGGCDPTGVCVLKDGLETFYDKVSSSDVIIVASPVYFGSVSAQAKMMIDRFQAFWVRMYVLKIPSNRKRRGIFLCSAGSDRVDFFENARHVVKNFFAAVNAEYYGEVFLPEADKESFSRTGDLAMRKARELGMAIAK